MSDSCSSFGTHCVQCSNKLIAPDWSEYRKERQVLHVWHCRKCNCRFETIGESKPMGGTTADDGYLALLRST